MGNKAQSDIKQENKKPNFISSESIQTNYNKNKAIIVNRQQLSISNSNNKRKLSYDSCCKITFHTFTHGKIEILKTYYFSLNEKGNAFYCLGQKITSNLKECEICENRKKSKSTHKKVRNSTLNVLYSNNEQMKENLQIGLEFERMHDIKKNQILFNRSKSFEYKIKLNNLYKEFIFTSNEDLNKSHENNIKIHPDTSKKNVVILDWDDTLLCTTHITPNGKFDEKLELCNKSIKKIEILQNSIINFFEMNEIQISDVYIVTNASKLWIEYSARRYLPNILNYMKNIYIISARDTFEKFFPMNQRIWKLETFRLIINLYKNDSIMNIICIGDSFIEMEAVNLLVGEYFIKSYIKSVKLNESPTLEELIKQLNLLIEQFPTIFLNNRSINVTFQKKEKKLKEDINYNK